MGKVLRLFSHAAALWTPDPVLPWLARWHVEAMAATTELVILWCLLRPRSHHFKLAVLSWLAVLFLLYRIGLRMAPASARAPCPCLGDLDRLVPLSKPFLALTSNLAFLYFLIGSPMLLLGTWLRRNANPRSDSTPCKTSHFVS